ncbi:MAG: 6-phosphogluconolactonase [Lysobacterales bacterium]|jgi:6-phosphogluconolactonase
MSVTEWFFDSRLLASQAAAARLSTVLLKDLRAKDEVTLIVSGGSSPKECFNRLSDIDLDWDRVHVAMSDERFIPADHPDSNEGMIRRELLAGNAASASIVAMFQEGISVADHCKHLEYDLRKLPRPYSAALLGMGEDGHFASLFPDFDRLEEGLDLKSKHMCMPVHTAASPLPRITMTLSALLQSREVLLLFFGDEKRKVYEQSKQIGSKYPLASLLQQNKTPVHTYWAP